MRAALWRMDFERGSREAFRWADAVVQKRDEESLDGEEGQWGESGRHSDCTLERQQSFGLRERNYTCEFWGSRQE